MLVQSIHISSNAKLKGLCLHSKASSCTYDYSRPHPFCMLNATARGDQHTMLSESRKTAEEGPVSVSVLSLAMERITPNAGWSSSG